MKITLEKTFELLQKSTAIVTDNGVVCPSLYEINIGGLNEFCSFETQDDQFLVYRYSFLEIDNQEVDLVGASLFLISSNEENDNKEVVQITLLKNWDAESDIVQSEAHLKNLEKYCFPYKGE